MKMHQDEVVHSLNESKKFKNSKGQTLLEFMLLMSLIAIISFAFMKVINTNLGERWTKFVNIIIDDPNVQAPALR